MHASPQKVVTVRKKLEAISGEDVFLMAKLCATSLATPKFGKMPFKPKEGGSGEKALIADSSDLLSSFFKRIANQGCESNTYMSCKI